MQENYFSKPLLLPSNGFEYEKICFIKPPTLEFILFNEDQFFQDSELEKQISFIRKYTSADPLSLYTFDFYYILASFHHYLHNGEPYKKGVQCLSCGAIHRLSVDLKTLPNIKILPSTASEVLNFEVKKLKIEYRRRKIVDNLEYSVKTLNDKDFPTVESKLIEFLIPQINKVIYEEKEITAKDDITKLLIFQNKKVLLNIYDKFTEKDFGLDDRISYICPKCKFKNFSSLYDDLEMSLYYPSQFNNNGAKVFFENLINANRFRFLGYSDFKDIPLHYFSLVTDVIKEAGMDHITAGRGM